MSYLPNRREAYQHPRHVLEGVRSIVMLGYDYRSQPIQSPPPPGKGRVARYAWEAQDYHTMLWDKLRSLSEIVLAEVPTAAVRGIVDTAPLLEREFAQLAGLGWQGKNTMLIHPRRGSYFFLAALLSDVELVYDTPLATDHCGTCRRCLDACPTQAFPQPYVLDATRCLSYLTIELRDAIPMPLRAGLGDWLFGCDICQEVCPWNRFAPKTAPADGGLPDAGAAVDLCELFWLDDGQFRARFRTTPLWRPKRRGLLRNAAIVLGNQRHAPAIPALARGLSDAEELVRAASAWALGEIGVGQALELLQSRLIVEPIPAVLREVQAALDRLDVPDRNRAGPAI